MICAALDDFVQHSVHASTWLTCELAIGPTGRLDKTYPFVDIMRIKFCFSKRRKVDRAGPGLRFYRYMFTIAGTFRYVELVTSLLQLQHPKAIEYNIFSTSCRNIHMRETLHKFEIYQVLFIKPRSAVHRHVAEPPCLGSGSFI